MWGCATSPPVKVDSADPADVVGQLAVMLLALFAQMEWTYTTERAAHARAVAAAHGRQVGRPSLLDPAVLAYAAYLRAPATRWLRSWLRLGRPAAACTGTYRPAGQLR